MEINFRIPYHNLIFKCFTFNSACWVHCVPVSSFHSPSDCNSKWFAVAGAPLCHKKFENNISFLPLNSVVIFACMPQPTAKKNDFQYWSRSAELIPYTIDRTFTPMF